MPAKKKILFVLTSHGKLGDSGEKTGFHYSEMTDPYYILQDHGLEVDIASIKGGNPPADPGSLKDDPDENAESVNRFRGDKSAMEKLKKSLKIDDVNMDEYAGIYLPGGHGTMWDFPESDGLKNAIEHAWAKDKIVAAVCHGPAGFINAKTKDGDPIFKNRRINCFTNEEEAEVNKEDIVPFLLESKLRELGGLFEHTDLFQAIIVEDSNLITGQNPPSAPLVANAILRTLGISPYEGASGNAEAAA